MRRSLVAALAVPVLLLSACGGDEPTVEDAPTTEEATTEEETATEEPTTEEETATEEPTTEEETATEEPTTDAAPTTEEPTEEETSGDAGGESSADGQAAADRTKEWLVAFVNGEEAVCDMMLDLDSEGTMKDDETDYPICVATFPSLASEMFDTETAGIIESMEISGADVDGDTAVVNKTHFSELFGAGMGEEVITLKKIDGEWFVDMNASF
ncbi:hypothetical protein MWU75_16095 [Ornithinimicrobium sp. F0845]|uniref:hypothetical protein n=1 Tax=Ornithinimicrobium sp. F0845 TaxID=2926412 RepID=UPI001FF4B0A8|nr:hypothetical protein [Ornithinimicrobium sp. F0845]MCK0113669.1 hypothetical protein [Ornithinimicrobium sp. F0845]